MPKFSFFVLLLTFVLFVNACVIIGKQHASLTVVPENKVSVQGQNREETRTALDFKLTDTKGATCSLSDYRGKQVVLLFFWTTWCPFCQAEIKKVSARVRELTGAGVEVLTINIGEPKDRVKRFMIDRKINLRALLDKDGAVSNVYNILGVPTFCLVDKHGKIIFEENNFPENYKEIISGK